MSWSFAHLLFLSLSLVTCFSARRVKGLQRPQVYLDKKVYLKIYFLVRADCTSAESSYFTARDT